MEQTENFLQRVERDEPLSCLFIEFLRPEDADAVYSRNPGLATASYELQHDTLLAAHFVAANPTRLAHEPGVQARRLIVNCRQLQDAWRREHKDAPLHPDSMLLDQVDRLAPQVVCLPHPFLAGPELLMTLRQRVKLLATRHDSPVPPRLDPGCFDLILTPHPQQSTPGTACYYAPLSHGRQAGGFLPFDRRAIEVSFVGRLWAQHTRKQRLLEHLARTTPILFWGDGVEVLAPSSPIHPRYRGMADGLEVQEILANSRITVHRHADADGRAWSRRLFEATGAGALLITDYHDNLADLFEIGREIVTYRNPGECREMIDHYLAHPAEAEAIARAGQSRTLRDHTYGRRIKEAIATFRQHLALVEAA
jgi:hypothetical protein